jgi:hypothetical protein
MIREKIRGSQLVNVLENHILDNKKMTATQVNAALGLLKKVVPDLRASEITGAGGKDLFPEEVGVLGRKPAEKIDP